MYLKFVGYNSGVNRKRVLNDPEMADFPRNVVTTEAICIWLFPSKETIIVQIKAEEMNLFYVYLGIKIKSCFFCLQIVGVYTLQGLKILKCMFNVLTMLHH